MVPAGTTIFDLGVSALALIQLLLAAVAIRSKGGRNPRRNIFLWLSILMSATFILVVQGYPRGYFSLPWRVWTVFFAAMGSALYCTALIYIRSIAESLYVSMNWNITMPVRIDLAFKLALFLVIASLVSSTIAVLVTNEIQWNGYILFPTICLLHLWFTPYMMYVILALYYKIADHLHTLRAHFYGYSMETGGPLSDYQTSFDAQDDSVLAKAVVAVVTSPPCTDNPISPTAGSRYGTGDSWNVPMCATNKDEKNRYQQQQQLPPGSPKSSSSMGKKMTRSSNTTMHSGQRSGNTTTSTSAPTKRGSNPKAAVSKSHYQIARSRELRKFESAMRKTRIVFVVWTICGIIAPVFSLITAVNLSRSDASASERRDRQFAEGSFNLLATISTLCLVLFNSLIVWSFGGPWRCYSRN